MTYLLQHFHINTDKMYRTLHFVMQNHVSKGEFTPFGYLLFLFHVYVSIKKQPYFYYHNHYTKKSYNKNPLKVHRFNTFRFFTVSLEFCHSRSAKAPYQLGHFFIFLQKPACYTPCYLNHSSNTIFKNPLSFY